MSGAAALRLTTLGGGGGGLPRSSSSLASPTTTTAVPVVPPVLLRHLVRAAAAAAPGDDCCSRACGALRYASFNEANCLALAPYSCLLRQLAQHTQHSGAASAGAAAQQLGRVVAAAEAAVAALRQRALPAAQRSVQQAAVSAAVQHTAARDEPYGGPAHADLGRGLARLQAAARELWRLEQQLATACTPPPLEGLAHGCGRAA